MVIFEKGLFLNRGIFEKGLFSIKAIFEIGATIIGNVTFFPKKRHNFWKRTIVSRVLTFTGGIV